VRHDDLNRLAMDDPDRLLAMLSDEAMTDADRSFAAEAAGYVQDRAKAQPVLLGLLLHGSALIREGAVYGLANDRDEPVLAALAHVGQHDRSAGVRDAAIEALAG
jgi:HEAT repeat protein